MKALVVREDRKLELREIQKPEAGPYEALVKIKACGICSSTDWEIIRGTQPYHNTYPCVIGHEGIGEVVSVGSKVKKFRIGDWVTRPAAIWPGQQSEGLTSGWGGFAEWGIAKDIAAMAKDGDLSFANDFIAARQNVVPAGSKLEDAVLGISLAETSSWFSQLGSVWGKSICVTGTGVAGLSMALWGKLSGSDKVIVIGRRNERLDLARELGADFVVNAKEGDTASRVLGITSGKGVDIFIEAAGQSDQLILGSSVLRSGGVIAPYGAPPGNRYDFSWGEMPMGSLRKFPGEDFKTYAWAIDLMKRKIIPGEKFMTHRWPLSEHMRAFREVAEGSVVKGFLKIEA